MVLLFGGQVDGNVILLFSSQYSLKMPSVCFAHKWCITSMTAKSSIINTEKPNSIALVTYEKEMEDILHIWGMKVLESEGIISLKCHSFMSVCGSSPSKFLLTDYTLAVVIEGKRLALLQIPHTPQRKKRFQFSDFPQRNHELEDSHKSIINSLLHCPVLDVFITGSDDGMVKVWDTSNQLIADLEIGWPLTSVGLAGEVGDLLISHHNVITHFFSFNFLPSDYSALIKRKARVKTKEKIVPFNPNLKFW